MKFTPITQQQYEDARYQFLLTTEEGGAAKLRPYVDSRGYITIGVGFNLNASKVRATFLAALGVQNSGANALFYKDLSDVLSNKYLDPIDAAKALSKLDTIMASRTAGDTFSFATESQVKSVFANLAPSYEAIVNSKVPSIPEYAAERVALYSIAYNTGGTGLGNGIKSAIAGSNRAEAWFEIRYNTNPPSSDSGGLAKRRYYEAQTLGLYDNPTSVTAEEAKQTYVMLTKHRDVIARYEALYGTGAESTTASVAAQRIASANNDYHLSGNAQVQTLYASLAPARDAFIGWVNSQLTAEQTPLTAGDWNPAAVFFNGPAQSLPELDARSLDGKGNGMENNLLVGANTPEFLRGGTGNDVLIGGGGQDFLDGGAGTDLLNGGDDDDVLVGGAGDDTLVGGAGDDTYVIYLSDGPQHDRIIDSDGKGTIIIYGKDGARLNTVILKKQDGSANAWSDQDGQVTISHNSPWKITLGDGSVIELGENFDPRGFGITLQEAAAEPTRTFVGDFTKKTEPGDPTRYVRDADGNYASDGAHANTEDVITGSSDADSMQGMGGNDALAGMRGDDFIDGGDGDDLLLGGLGADTLNGGAGSDYIYGAGTGGLTYLTGTGSAGPAARGPERTRGLSWVTYDSSGSTYSVLGANAFAVSGDGGNVINGGAGDDFLLGGDAADVIHGGDDADLIEGLGGDDVLFGDAGDDLIAGDGLAVSGRLDTTLAPQHGNDLLVGGKGNDYLIGGGGNDELFGGADNDTLHGDARSDDFAPLDVHGDDYLDGGDGVDKLDGGGKDDTLYGGAGDDVLVGDDLLAALPGQYHGDDYLDGGDGNDLIEGGGKSDELFGGTGNDTLWGDASEAGLSGTQNGADYLDGEAGNDELVGGGNDDTLVGGEGNDYLIGDDSVDRVAVVNHGDDYLDGGTGDDTLFGGGGADELLGGSGNDTLYGDGAIEDVPAAAHRADLLDGGDGNDLLSGQGGDDTLFGGAGNDTLVGGDGDDYLEGGDGVDALFGGAGNDTLVSDGVDYLDGGEGDDTYLIAGKTSGTVVNYDDASGANTVYVAGANGASSQVFAQNGSWYLTTGGGGVIGLGSNASLAGMVLKSDENDVGISAQAIADRSSIGRLVRSGSWNGTIATYTRDIVTAQTIVGTERAEWLEGGTGVDYLTAGGGDDRLDGGSGGDALYGGNGADTLRGGQGSDTLWAANAAGNNDLKQDIYLFARGDGSDYIRFSALPADGARDVIRFDAGISRSDIRVSAVLSSTLF